MKKKLLTIALAGLFSMNVAFAEINQNSNFDYLVLVNKTENESKVHLINVKNSFGKEFQIEKETYNHFVKLRNEMLKEGIQIELDSIYRSVARQQEIVEEFTQKYGADYVKKYVAIPGFSEHHTGLAVDICLVIDNKIVDDNDEMIAQKEIFRKIHKRLANNGFILRYPLGKENITGYSYEPWHFRYVGEDIAKIISEKNLTLEEYLTQNQNVKIIPYPENLDIKSTGASSAPDEINHANSIYFTQNDFYNMKSTNNRVILQHYPTYQQTTEYTCGPAAALTVLYHYGNENYDEMSLAAEMKTQDYPIGTNPANMVKFFKSIGWNVDSSLNHKIFAEYVDFKNWVVDNLNSNTPIMVENVEWGGHWRVIIGYDTMRTENSLDDILIMVDPYDTSDHNQDGYIINNGERFFSMWFDHSILPKKQRNQPWIIAKPKTEEFK